ncbi:hypothetical protein DFH27DRAFT_584089 [Peziza echinospora]|nr:hypothetical protein DFH27DRAFT_584089 [Peziza echinospora]
MAPANASALFYPLYHGLEFNAQWQNNSLARMRYNAPTALRALSNVEVLRKGYGGRKLDSVVAVAQDAHDPTKLSYAYTVTGTDFGLQHAGGLKYHVKGACSAAVDNATWKVSSPTIRNPSLDRSLPTNASRGIPVDMYTLWPNDARWLPWQDNLTNALVLVFRDAYGVAPHARFYDGPISPGNGTRPFTGGNGIEIGGDALKRFAIVPHTAGRISVTPGTDVWYQTKEEKVITEMVREKVPSIQLHEVLSKRPPLMCTQSDVWQYGSWTGGLDTICRANTTSANVPGLKIPESLLLVLCPELWLTSKISSLGAAAPQIGLDSTSRLIYQDYLTLQDAGGSSMLADFKRLVQASYVATRDIFYSTTLPGPLPHLKADPDDNRNNALIKDGKPLPGAGDFVVRSSRVTTLRMKYLIGVPVAIGILALLNLLLFIITGRNQGVAHLDHLAEDRFTRYVMYTQALTATHLYRTVDQTLSQSLLTVGTSRLSPGMLWKNQVDDVPIVNTKELIKWMKGVWSYARAQGMGPEFARFKELEASRKSSDTLGKRKSVAVTIKSVPATPPFTTPAEETQQSLLENQISSPASTNFNLADRDPEKHEAFTLWTDLRQYGYTAGEITDAVPDETDGTVAPILHYRFPPVPRPTILVHHHDDAKGDVSTLTYSTRNPKDKSFREAINSTWEKFTFKWKDLKRGNAVGENDHQVVAENADIVSLARQATGPVP